MKILQVTIKKVRTPSNCHFEYPQGWNAQKMHVLAYEGSAQMGKVQEECLCVTDDETAIKLLKQSGVTEISIGVANTFGRTWRPATATITDEKKVCDAIRKALAHADVVDKLKDVLEKTEMDGLDENNSEPGVEKSEEFDIREFIS